MEIVSLDIGMDNSNNGKTKCKPFYITPVPPTPTLLVMDTIHRGIVVITTAQLYSTKTELRFSAGSSPAQGVLEIRDGEDL